MIFNTSFNSADMEALTILLEREVDNRRGYVDTDEHIALEIFHELFAIVSKKIDSHELHRALLRVVQNDIGHCLYLVRKEANKQDKAHILGHALDYAISIGDDFSEAMSSIDEYATELERLNDGEDDVM